MDTSKSLIFNSVSKYLDEYSLQTDNTTHTWTPELAEQFRNTSLDDLLFDPYFLDLGKKNLETGEPQLYQYWTDTIHELWEERKIRDIDLVIFSCAIGAGKSYFASVLQWLQCYELVTVPGGDPHKYFGLDPYSKIAFINMSRSAKQSKNITFDYVASRFKTKFNQDYFPPDDKVKSELRIKRSNILVFPGTSSDASALGYNVYSGSLDECNFLPIVEDSKKIGIGSSYDPAESWYNAVSMRMKSRFRDPRTGKVPGFITMISSPTYPDTFMEQRIRLAESGDVDSIFFKRASIWEVKPKKHFFMKWYETSEIFKFDTDSLEIISDEAYASMSEEKRELVQEIPIDLIDDYKKDPDRAIRDISAISMEALCPFFRNKFFVNKAMQNDLKHIFSESTNKILEDLTKIDIEAPRYVHIDLAKAGDSCGVSMCHVSGRKLLKRDSIFTKEILNEEIELPIIDFDFVARLSGDHTDEIIFSDVREIIYELRNIGFFINLITFDQWQSTDSIQILRDSGFTADNLSIDRTNYKVVVDYDKNNFIRRESTDKNYIAPMQDLKYALYESRVNIPYHEWLLKEFFWAEYDAKKNKVDHRPGKSIDVLHSVAGSFFNCINNEFDFVDVSRELEKDLDNKYYEEIEEDFGKQEDVFLDSEQSIFDSGEFEQVF